MKARGLLSVVMTGAMMMGVLSGCGDFEPDIIWIDPNEDTQASYTVEIEVEHNGTLDIENIQKVKDDGTLNFTATPAEGHHFSGIEINGRRLTNVVMPEDEVKVSLQDVNTDLKVVILCGSGSGSGSGAVSEGTDNGEPIKYEDVIVEASFEGQQDTEIEIEDRETNIISDEPNEMAGTVTLMTDEVVDGGEAQIQVEPAKYYIADVSATVGNDPVNEIEYNEENHTYTVDDVNGEVEFNVTFRDAPIEQIKIIGEPRKSYNFDEHFDMSQLTAEITYGNENKSIRKVYLDQPQVDTDGKSIDGTLTVDPADGYLVFGNQSVKVCYTVGKVGGETEITDVNVTMNDSDSEALNELFMQITKDANGAVGDAEQVIDTTEGRLSNALISDGYGYGTTADGSITFKCEQGGQDRYSYTRWHVEIKNQENAERVFRKFNEIVQEKAEISASDDSHADPYKAYVYIVTNVKDGTCDIWVAYNRTHQEN